MSALETFRQELSTAEHSVISQLNAPPKIQAFLDGLAYSAAPVYRSPLRVLRDRMAHCFDGALFAAAVFRLIGYPPLILDLLPNHRDDDHLLAVYKVDGYWGAIAKSNFVGLRFREPIYRTLRELVLSYFEQYYNIEREKTLRGYTLPLNVASFDELNWMTEDAPLELIAQRLDKIRRVSIVTDKMAENLTSVDQRTYQAGLFGSNAAGLFKPE